MARELTPMQQALTTPTQQITSNNAFDQLGQAAGEMGALVARKASSLAIEEQTRKGQADALEGIAPEKLMLPLTAGTKAYNNAVAETEARRQAISAQQQISEALINHTNPANFNRDTPAQFSATLQGIIEGTLDNARDETRAALSNQLSALSSHAQIKMLEHSINYDNQQTKLDFTHDISQLKKLRRDAIISGDDKLATAMDIELDNTLEDYGIKNAEIATLSAQYKEQFAEDKQIANVLGGYAKATTEGTTSEYLNSFAKNTDNLPFDVWQKAAKELVTLQGQEQRLTHDINAQELQQAQNAIDNGTVSDVDDLLALPNITVTQQLQLMHRIEARDRQQFKNQEKFLNAQNHILKKQSAMVSGSVSDEMFEATQAQFEQVNGRAMTLTDMVESALGVSGFPVSGLPNTAFGRDIPAINAQMTNQLQSKNPTLVREAAEAFNRVVKVGQEANAINISGRALDIATLFNQLNKGQEDPNTLAQEVRNTVMDVSEKEYNARADYFHRNFEINPRTGKSKLDGKFKEILGVNPQAFKTDAAMNFFKAEYRLSYLNSNSEEAADASVRYKMRSWGTSKYFDEGLVAQPVPEKELNITQIGYAFDNQYRLRVQDIIQSNQQQITQGLNVHKIEWEQPKEQSIDANTLTDDDKVFKRLGMGQRDTLQSFGQYPRPRIKVDGRSTEVFLVPGPESRLGERVQFALFYKDRFGNMQPIQDPNTATGVAMFSPDGLEEFAPSVFEGQFQEQLKEQALAIQRAQAKQEFDSLKGLPTLGFLFPSLDAKVKFLRDPERAGEAMRKLFSSDATEIQEMLRQKIQSKSDPTSAQQLASAATEAANVGITSDSGQE